MKFSVIPKGNYKVGQDINVNGVIMMVESYAHTGRNLIAVSKRGAARFERRMIILSDEKSIEEIPAILTN
jgi:hypothetical protein